MGARDWFAILEWFRTRWINVQCWSIWIKINADQCGSADQHWEELIHIDQYWSLLIIIGINARKLITYWSTFISITHWSIMSWQFKALKCKEFLREKFENPFLLFLHKEKPTETFLSISYNLNFVYRHLAVHKGQIKGFKVTPLPWIRSWPWPNLNQITQSHILKNINNMRSNSNRFQSPSPKIFTCLGDKISSSYK